MPEDPAITAILVIPGLAPHFDNARPQPGEIVSIGLVLDDERVAWGVCPATDGLAAAINTIQRRVVPALQSQRLASFRPLATKVDALMEQVTITETLPRPETEGQSSKFSRRALFAGRLWSAESPPERAPQTRQVRLERPVAAAIRYGVSQALLAAVAVAGNQTIAEAIAAEYGLSQPDTTVAIHAPAGRPTGEPAAALEAVLPYQVSTLGYTIAGDNDKEELGDHGEILQRFVRHLPAQLAAAPDSDQLIIDLDVKGAFGRLHDNDAGKILGALYGLEQAARPYRVRVVDPAVAESCEAQVALMRQLKDYVRLRGLRLELVARAWVDTPGNVETFMQSEAAHLLRLDANRLGSLHRSIEAILAGRERGIGVLLAGGDGDGGRSAEILAQVALATQPDAIVAPDNAHGVALVQNEMARTLAWLGVKNSR